MDLTTRILACDFIGKCFGVACGKNNEEIEPKLGDFSSTLKKAEIANPWFTQENINFQLEQWSELLKEHDLKNWINPYSLKENNKTVGIVAAGNLPFVGLHDLISVILSGNNVAIKLSSKDEVLMQWVVNLLELFNPEFKNVVKVVERLNNIDAVIATGSNNSARYFESYFGHIPNIIRKNRTSIAVLNGNESKEELNSLGQDIFRYFGLGCRNVTQLLVPENYEFTNFFESIYDFGFVMNHNKYMNNHTYHKAIYLMNNEQFLDNNFLLLKNSNQLFSPIASLFYYNYNNLEDVNEFINLNKENIQCVVGKDFSIKFGESQKPKLNDYADGINTLEFLNKI